MLNNFHLKVDEIPYKYYPVPKGKYEVVKKVTEEWRENGVIEPWNSTIFEPLAIVTKADGSLRPYGDFCEVNKFMETRGERIPRIEDVKIRFARIKWFSTLDFKSGFLQIPLHVESRMFCAFVFDGKPWPFTRVPFGCRDSLCASLAGIHKVLEGCESFSVTYIDDVLIMSDSEENHVKHLDMILDRIEKSGMTLNLDM